MLGNTVFDEYGCPNPETKFPSLAAPIWYLESHAPIGNEKCSALLGVHNDTGYYLLSNQHFRPQMRQRSQCAR